MARLFFWMMLLAAGSCLGAGKKPMYLISVHEEGDAAEGERKIQAFPINGEKHYFRKNPILTQRNFKAYWAFPAEDGKSWGAVFWLDLSGQHAMQRLGADRGKYIATAVNRQPADAVYVDGAPSDGRFVVWKNLSSDLFTVIDKEKKIRRIGDPATAAGLAKRAAERGPASPVAGVPVGAPATDDAILGAIDAATLADASRGMPSERPPGRESAPGRAVPNRKKPGSPPFSPDETVERPDLLPLPDPGVKR